MHLLAIETSSPRGSLALFSDGVLRRESAFPEGLIHGREITSRLEALLREEGLAVRSLGAIAVSIGPGSYTGLRVGVTAAKTLGYALGIPVLTESSLRVTAGGAAESLKAGTLIAPVLDGRLGFFFGALFVAGWPLERRAPDSACELSRLEATLVAGAASEGAEVVVVGEGADAFLSVVAKGAGAPRLAYTRGPRESDVPRGAVLGRLVAPSLAAARLDLEAIHNLEPAYLRVTEAERRWAAGSGA